VSVTCRDIVLLGASIGVAFVVQDWGREVGLFISILVCANGGTLLATFHMWKTTLDISLYKPSQAKLSP